MNTRQHPRVLPRTAVDARVKVAGQNGPGQVFRTHDLSRSGLFLYTKLGSLYDFKVGTTMDVELIGGSMTGGAIRVRAKVVVVRIVQAGSPEAAAGRPTGFGCKIVSLEDSERDALAKLITTASEESPPPVK